jgi:hypothetical protein
VSDLGEDVDPISLRHRQAVSFVYQDNSPVLGRSRFKLGVGFVIRMRRGTATTSGAGDPRSNDDRDGRCKGPECNQDKVSPTWTSLQSLLERHFLVAAEHPNRRTRQQMQRATLTLGGRSVHDSCMILVCSSYGKELFSTRLHSTAASNPKQPFENKLSVRIASAATTLHRTSITNRAVIESGRHLQHQRVND